MPDSIWNDQWYDSSAIYTGSATIVDGKVVQVYPGLCRVGTDNCPGGTNLCIAIAADPTDPLATNWTKDATITGAVNPIVNNTGRDPSTAWKTPSGEWRLTTFDTMIMGSMDFKKWYRIGAQKQFPTGECPSFFELPATTPGAGPAPAGAGIPTHVHKNSHGGKDWMQVGTYVAGAPKVLGTWKNTPGVPRVDACIDTGDLYASKDFYDPIGKRRVNWGWARVPPSSTQTLPREVTWHPELQQLVFSPLAEQAALRASPPLFSQSSVAIPAGLKTPLQLKLPAGTGLQSEVYASFPIPTAATTFGILLFGKYEAFVSFAPAINGIGNGVSGSWQVQVGVGTAPSEINSSNSTTDRGAPGPMLNLLPSDKQIDIRVYYDQTFAEVFFMNGRVAITKTLAGSAAADHAVFSSAAITANNVSAWSVNSIWTTPEDVIATPRL
jgi:sucrose-6-phosphate hydrolase SacC (GH32 family)